MGGLTEKQRPASFSSRRLRVLQAVADGEFLTTDDIADDAGEYDHHTAEWLRQFAARRLVECADHSPQFGCHWSITEAGRVLLREGESD